VARNLFGGHLLREDTFTHLVMLDLDHEHPMDIVGHLCESVAEDPKRLAVSALAFRRGEPYEPIAFEKGDDGLYYSIIEWEPGEVLAVDQFSTSACIIAREVFERIPRPWFRYTYPGSKDTFPSEDIWFCEKGGEAGIQFYVDTRIRTTHLGIGKVNESVFRGYMELQRRKVEAKNEG